MNSGTENRLSCIDSNTKYITFHLHCILHITLWERVFWLLSLLLLFHWNQNYWRKKHRNANEQQRIIWANIVHINGITMKRSQHHLRNHQIAIRSVAVLWARAHSTIHLFPSNANTKSNSNRKYVYQFTGDGL